MEENIKVSVIEYADRKYLLLGYRDPTTGRLKTKSAKTADRKAAEKAAIIWETELREGRYTSPSKTTWADFRERYESEVATGLAPNTREKIGLTLDMVEKRLNPQRVRDVTPQRLSWLAAELRKPYTRDDKEHPGLAESSIQSHLAHLKAALRWAERCGLIVKAPAFPKLQRTKGDVMKGRPISGEEFDRLIAAVPKVIEEPARVAEWERYLRGLHDSGFRITESLALSWDEGAALEVDLSGRYPVVHIQPEGQKSHRGQTMPLAPEFAETLMAIPTDERTGHVFRPLSVANRRVSRAVAIKTISAIGKKAGVKVWTNPRSKAVKYATAHDLRRAFGLRWSSRVMPAVLQQMMRHATISTTLKYYVGRDAQTAGGVIWEAFNKLPSVNTSVNSADSDQVSNQT